MMAKMCTTNPCEIMMACVGTLLCLSLIIMVTVCGEILTISAKLNSTVHLPCQVTPDHSLTPHVRWRTESETVFERQGKRFYQSEGYEDRVDVPEDELLKGNCSLVLKNVRYTDANIYKSYMWMKQTKRSVVEKRVLVQNITLIIDDKPDPSTAEPGVGAGAAGMMCSDSLIIFISSLLLFIYQ